MQAMIRILLCLLCTSCFGQHATTLLFGQGLVWDVANQTWVNESPNIKQEWRIDDKRIHVWDFSSVYGSMSTPVAPSAASNERVAITRGQWIPQPYFAVLEPNRYDLSKIDLNKVSIVAKHWRDGVKDAALWFKPNGNGTANFPGSKRTLIPVLFDVEHATDVDQVNQAMRIWTDVVGQQPFAYYWHNVGTPGVLNRDYIQAPNYAGLVAFEKYLDSFQQSVDTTGVVTLSMYLSNGIHKPTGIDLMPRDLASQAYRVAAVRKRFPQAIVIGVVRDSWQDLSSDDPAKWRDIPDDAMYKQFCSVAMLCDVVAYWESQPKAMNDRPFWRAVRKYQGVK